MKRLETISQCHPSKMGKRKKSSLEKLLKKVASEWDFEIYGLNLKTNQNS